MRLRCYLFGCRPQRPHGHCRRCWAEYHDGLTGHGPVLIERPCALVRWWRRAR